MATLEPCRTAWPRAWRVRMATAALARATVVPCGMSIRGLWAGRAIYKNHLFCVSPPPGGEARASRGARPNCTGNAIGRRGGVLDSTRRTPGSRRLIVGILLRGRNTRILVILHHFVVCMADCPGHLVPPLEGNAHCHLAAVMKPCSKVSLAIRQNVQRLFRSQKIISCMIIASTACRWIQANCSRREDAAARSASIRASRFATLTAYARFSSACLRNFSKFAIRTCFKSS